MTIEEEFFKAFGVKPKKAQQIVGNDVFFNVIENEYYPEITAEKLLDLASILMLQFQVVFYFDYEFCFSSEFSNSTRPICNRCNDFKELIIRTTIVCGGIDTLKKEIEPQIRKLFEE